MHLGGKTILVTAAAIALAAEGAGIVAHGSILELTDDDWDRSVAVNVTSMVRLNAAAAAILQRMRLDIDPRTPMAGLTIARQQMVEIAKALSYRSRVLIMDEPTAALNDAEIAELFTIIDQLRAEGVGIICISHKMDEIKRISDRVTVMRDGACVDAVAAADMPIARIISLMVGPEISDEKPMIPDLSAAETAREVRNLSRGRELKDISFSRKRGEIPGFAGLMGAGRTELARAIFGAEPCDHGDILVHGRPVSIRTPADAAAFGRQPAEGGDREMAFARLRHPDL